MHTLAMLCDIIVNLFKILGSIPDTGQKPMFLYLQKQRKYSNFLYSFFSEKSTENILIFSLFYIKSAKYSEMF